MSDYGDVCQSMVQCVSEYNIMVVYVRVWWCVSGYGGVCQGMVVCVRLWCSLHMMDVSCMEYCGNLKIKKLDYGGSISRINCVYVHKFMCKYIVHYTLHQWL